jgi:hypothetical protein
MAIKMVSLQVADQKQGKTGTKFEYCTSFGLRRLVTALLASAKHFWGVTAGYAGSRIIGSNSKNTKAAMNRRTSKIAKLEVLALNRTRTQAPAGTRTRTRMGQG